VRRSVAGMDTPTLTEAVRRELLVRSQVTESTHRFGGIEFRLGRRELGQRAVAARGEGDRERQEAVA